MANITAVKAFKLYCGIPSGMRLLSVDQQRLGEFKRLLSGERDSVCIDDCVPHSKVTLAEVADVLELNGYTPAVKFIKRQPGWKHASEQE